MFNLYSICDVNLMTLRINVNGHTARNDCVENVVH